MTDIWNTYACEDFYDEVMSSPGNARKPAKKLVSYFKTLSDDTVELHRKAAESTIKEMGVSFTVYSDQGNIDRAWPFDIVPRTINKAQWDVTAAGLKQRLKALNLFIDDIYK